MSKPDPDPDPASALPAEPLDDPATTELLSALDALYPLPDDAQRVERAGRTAFVLTRWMQRREAELEALVPTVTAAIIDRARANAVSALPAGDGDPPLIAQLRYRIAWLEGTAMPHARKQENANGFQKGWHAALSRASERVGVTLIEDLRALVPEPSADPDDTLPMPAARPSGIPQDERLRDAEHLLRAVLECPTLHDESGHAYLKVRARSLMDLPNIIHNFLAASSVPAASGGAETERTNLAAMMLAVDDSLQAALVAFKSGASTTGQLIVSVMAQCERLRYHAGVQADHAVPAAGSPSKEEP